MKLSKYAKKLGVTYQTAWNLFSKDQIPGAYQLKTGTIIVPEEQKIREIDKKIVIYCRVSNYSRKKELQYQVDRCLEFCHNRGYEVDKIYKEIASGMNDKRKQLTKMLDSNPSIIVVEHKDRLTRFGFNYLETLLKKLDCQIVVINRDHEDEQDLIKDLVSIITSFCCRLYGLRRGKNKTNKIKEIIDNNE